MYYKVFKSDLTCRNYQFEVGKTYHQDGQIELCKNGFHFHSKVGDLFEYYDFDPSNIVCEIEANGEVIHGDDKSVCSDITIIKQLSWNEVLELVNLGVGNTGMKNSGNSNSGYSNSGNYNSGSFNSGSFNSGSFNSGYSNSGYYNSGNSNSGYSNSGNYNSGNYNFGNYNSGYSNSGSYNSGSCNSGSCNSGSCNSIDGRMMLFNTILDMSVKEFWSKYTIPICPILTEYKDGELITYDYKEAWKKSWENSSEKGRQYMMNLPGFTKENFKEVTGIEL
jgi:hypothetical protein